MKYIIIYLNYQQSRLDNPTYKKYSSTPSCVGDVSLLFINGRLEDRVLLHQVADLISKRTKEDVTFLLCSDVVNKHDHEQIINSARVIRRNFKPDAHYNYSTFLFVPFPQIDTCSESGRRDIWHNLVHINNACCEYADCHLFNGFFGYSHSEPAKLTDFIFHTIQSGIPFTDYIEGNSPTPFEYNKASWLPMFNFFNLTSIEYPEKEISSFFNRLVIKRVFEWYLPSNNPYPANEIVKYAEDIASSLPLETQQICLQNSSFITTDNNVSDWDEVASYWNYAVETSDSGLAEIRKQEWLGKILQNMSVLYQCKFRKIGVDYHFSVQQNKIEDYCKILYSVVESRLDKMIQTGHFTSDAAKSIVNALINILQQKVIEIQQINKKLEQRLPVSESTIETMNRDWQNLSFFDRLMGKDKKMLAAFKTALAENLICKTQIPGCSFAIRLLNELISMVSPLANRFDHWKSVFSGAIQTLDDELSSLKSVIEQSPLCSDGFANIELTFQIKDALMEKWYNAAVSILMNSRTDSTGNELITRFNAENSDDIMSYVKGLMESGELPKWLDTPLLTRIRNQYDALGDIQSFIEKLKQDIPVPISVKEMDGIDKNAKQMDEAIHDNYCLIASQNMDDVDLGLKYYSSSNPSLVVLLHIRQGISLPRLSGFGVQRIIIETSIF